jgi:hypothetical protein
MLRRGKSGWLRGELIGPYEILEEAGTAGMGKGLESARHALRTRRRDQSVRGTVFRRRQPLDRRRQNGIDGDTSVADLLRQDFH